MLFLTTLMKNSNIMFLKLNESFVKMHGHKHDPNPLFVTKRVVIFLDHILTDNVINHSSFSTTSNFQIVYWQFHQIKAILVWYLSYIIEMFCRKLLNLWNLCLKGHSTLTKFWLCWHFLPCKSWQKVNIFGLPTHPLSSCQRS